MPQRTLNHPEHDIHNLNDAGLLLLRAVISFFLLVLPAFAACLLAARRQIRDTVCLGSIGLAATACSGYLVFWSWFLRWRLVRPCGVAAHVLALLYIVYVWRSTPREARMALKPLLAPALLVLTSTLVILTATFAYGGEDAVFETADARFSHPLRLDNELPFILARDMMKLHAIPSPMAADWLSSDRPPLQTGVVLSQYFALNWQVNMGYQVLSMLLQSLWIFGLWLLLQAFQVRRAAISVILGGCLCSSFVFVNTEFVWPKLLAAAYLLGFLALLVGSRLERGATEGAVMALTAGVLLAWSLLAHGGTVFAFAGLAFLAIVYRRSFNVQSVAVLGATVIVLYLPWMLYQKLYDPPANHLLKMHLAGVYPVDKRALLPTLSDSYRARTIGEIVEYKKRNLQTAFTSFEFWPLVRAMFWELPAAQPARAQARVDLAKRLNAAQFFSFPCAAGLFVPGLACLVLGAFSRFRTKEWRAAVLLLVFTLVTNFFWSLVMFGPATTTVHQGAYAAMLALFAAGILGWWVLSRWVALAVTLLQASLFVYTNGVILKPEGAPHFDVIALCLVAAAGTIYLLVQLWRVGPACLE